MCGLELANGVKTLELVGRAVAFQDQGDEVNRVQRAMQYRSQYWEQKC